MRISGKIKYNKAIILTQDKMRELEAILQKYCSVINYEAETISDSEILFSSLDELLEYDNFENRSLKSLKISASGNLARNLRLYFEVSDYSLGIIGYSKTFHCNFEVDDPSVETTIKEEINLL